MYTATMMYLGQATDRQRDLIAEAEVFHLLAAARRRRRRERSAAREAAASHPAGTLSACGSSVAAPAR